VGTGVGTGVGAGVGTAVGVGAGVGGFGVGFGARTGVGVGLRVAAGVGVAGVVVSRLVGPATLGEARTGETDGLGESVGSSLDAPPTAFGTGLGGSPVADRTPPSVSRGTNTSPRKAIATADAATTPAIRRWRLSELAGWACRRRWGSWPRTGVVGAFGTTGIAGGWACNPPLETIRRVGIMGAGAPAIPMR
jgi:hypothetical protein